MKDDKISKEKLKELRDAWMLQKVMNCDLRGIGFDKATEIAKANNLDPQPLCFASMVREKGDVTVGVVFLEDDGSGIGYQYGYSFSIDSLIAIIKEQYPDNDNIWVKLGQINLNDTDEDYKQTVVIKGEELEEG